METGLLAPGVGPDRADLISTTDSLAQAELLRQLLTVHCCLTDLE